MGLITGLLTLPLAPVRGTVWLAERIQELGGGLRMSPPATDPRVSPASPALPS